MGFKIGHLSGSVSLDVFQRVGLQPTTVSKGAYAALSSMVDRMEAIFEAGAPIAPAMFDAGAPMQPTMEAISSSRDGIFDTASTPARSSVVPPMAPPRISIFLLS